MFFQICATLLTRPRIAITHHSIGLTVGFLASSILLGGVIGGAVNAVIVCFAESPLEFHINHQKLSRELRAGWALELPGKNFSIDEPSNKMTLHFS